MVIVLDSSFLIDHLRGLDEATTAFADGVLAGHEFAGSLVSKVELLAGMRSSEKRTTRALLMQLTWVPVDDPIAELAGEYGRIYRSSHQGIDVSDFVIAATAMKADAELWTRNVEHFPMFDDLESPY